MDPVRPPPPLVTPEPHPAGRPPAPLQASRRYELDRLRVMVVCAVFLFHTARFFDPMDWHVKNATRHPLLVPPMMFLAVWAMPLLFLVSGAGAFFALRARGARRFAVDRALRLLVPLAFGALALGAWQVYLERVSHGEFQGSFVEFVPLYFHGSHGSGGNFAWMGLHLWFLALLLLFSLGFLPAMVWLQRDPCRRWLTWLGDGLARGGRVHLLALPVVLALLVPAPGRFWSDRTFGGWNLLAHACFFLDGFLLVSSEGLYDRVRRLRWSSLAAALALGAWVGAAWPRSGDLAQGTLRSASLLAGFAFVSWAALLAFVGFGIQGRRAPTPLLARANEAVLPIYVLHQPVILGLGYLVVAWPIPDLAKWALIACGSLAACLALYQLLVRRFAVLRFLFGMRPSAPRPPGDGLVASGRLAP